MFASDGKEETRRKGLSYSYSSEEVKMMMSCMYTKRCA